MSNPASATPPFIMATSHGTHSAETWAETIAKMIFPISPNIEAHRLQMAQNTQKRVANALVETIDEIIKRERELLNDEHYMTPYDGGEFVASALSAVYYVTDASVWKIYMRNFDDFLRWELRRHFDHIQHVERLWHADHNPSDAANKYRAQYTQ